MLPLGDKMREVRCVVGAGPRLALSLLASVAFLSAGLVPATAQTGIATNAASVLARIAIDPYRRAIAEAAAADPDISAFYADTDYAPLWTGDDQAARREALLSVLAGAGAHGLPTVRYDPETLIAAFDAARTEGDRGRLDVMMTEAMLDYARDVQTGALVPQKVDAGIVREVPMRDRRANLELFLRSDPAAFFASLPPRSPAYAQLMKAKFRLEAADWGPEIVARSLKPGDRGPAFLQLRDRLEAMGYLSRSLTGTYGDGIEAAVMKFQADHGLESDGIASAATLRQINVGPADRLHSVLVAMERERWMNIPRGKRHIWVNLTDFTAKIIDDGRVTFETKSVIGKAEGDRKTPEFSDMMDYMVVNPTWNIPRSITTREYLPMMQRNPYAAGHLRIVDRRGRTVPREAIDFTAYTARTFPYAMKQAPSDGNALGLVKFMFPNKYNIYLHDTPTKSLFKRDVRAFSHGCIRLGDPFDFAYALLAVQSADPEGEFRRRLRSKAESTIALKDPVPVHLVYFTAYPEADGHMTYRPDIYGRDAEIYAALVKAGLVPDA